MGLSGRGEKNVKNLRRDLRDGRIRAETGTFVSERRKEGGRGKKRTGGEKVSETP